MIDKNKCILLGMLAKTLGVDGSLVLRLSGFETDDIRDPESVFIEIDGLLVPFFIESLRERSSRELVVKFMDVDSADQAKELTNLQVFITGSATFPAKTTFPEDDVKDYRVMDIQTGFVGIAEKIVDLAQNPLLKVIREEQEFFIPFHQDIILEINRKKKTITIDAPDGLFEL